MRRLDGIEVGRMRLCGCPTPRHQKLLQYSAQNFITHTCIPGQFIRNSLPLMHHEPRVIASTWRLLNTQAYKEARIVIKNAGANYNAESFRILCNMSKLYTGISPT